MIRLFKPMWPRNPYARPRLARVRDLAADGVEMKDCQASRVHTHCGNQAGSQSCYNITSYRHASAQRLPPFPPSSLVKAETMSLTDYEVKVRNHAVLMGTAFLVILPTGVLIARYLRNFTNRSAYSRTLHTRTRLTTSSSICPS